MDLFMDLNTNDIYLISFKIKIKKSLIIKIIQDKYEIQYK